MASSSGTARLALVGLLGLVALSGCSVVVGGVLDGKDSDGGAPVMCTSDPMCDDGNPCTEDRCPDGVCRRPNVPDGTPCNGDGMCRVGACMPCPLGGCMPSCATITCGGDDMCVDGVCVPFMCNDFRPCPPGKVCVGGACASGPPPCGDGVVDVAMGEECEPPGFGDCLPNCMWRCIDASNCDDGDVCTTDICDPVSDCMWTPGVDGDMDGYLSAACAGGNDCKDTDSGVHPGATEECNTIDDDCNAVVDDVTFVTGWYADFDGDGFGDPMMIRCPGSAGDVNNGDDCYDRNVDARPGVTTTFYDVDRGDGSFDYDCDGAQTKEYGPPSCADGGSNSCPGMVSCSGARGLVGPTICGNTYPLIACANCRSTTGSCGPGAATTNVTLGCR